MVVTPDPLATDVGAAILRSGGTAADAAVAVGFTLAVTYPRSGNIGGGGFLLYRDGATGGAWVVDFRETAPAAATRDMFLDAAGHPLPGDSLEGMRAVGVPGTVAGMAEAHRRWGRRPWSDLLAPAVRFADEGFTISPFLSSSFARYREALARHPETASIFLLPDGSAPPPGHRLQQPDLATTLRRVASKGKDGFYRGPTARAIAREMAARGGLITGDDLAAYRTVVRRPLEGQYRGFRVLTVPPPSSGGVTLIESLLILEGFDLASLGHHSSATVHLIVEAERRAFADRAVHLGDPGFVSVPTDGLVSREYAALRRADLDPARATPSHLVTSGDPWPFQGGPERPEPAGDPVTAESPETNHFSIVDGNGNAVAVTYTLNSNFGAKVVARGTGVLLNNEMDDFSVAPGVANQFDLVGGSANAIAPGKRMLSSMAPTMLERDGRLVLVAGAPGGPTIISTVLQILLNVVDFSMDPMAAVCAARVHHQWLPDEIHIEPGALAADVVANLVRRGHQVVEKEPLGGAHVIGRDAVTGEWLGAADPRRHGSARGD